MPSSPTSTATTRAALWSRAWPRYLGHLVDLTPQPRVGRPAGPQQPKGRELALLARLSACLLLSDLRRNGVPARYVLGPRARQPRERDHRRASTSLCVRLFLIPLLDAGPNEVVAKKGKPRVGWDS
jgi:hypothetical protein